MLTTLSLALCLAGAPLSFENGEFLGFTEDGNAVAWTSTVDNRAMEPPRRITSATVRNLLQATEAVFELEVRPFGEVKATPTPGADVAKWEAWKKANPLVKPTAHAEVKTSLRVNGKDAAAWGGDGKAVKVEVATERLGVRHVAASQFASYRGKKLPRTSGASFVDPTGRRVAFVLSSDASGAEPASGELVIVEAGPTVEVFVAEGADLDAKLALVEQAGFAVTGSSRSKATDTGLSVIGDAQTMPAAEALAKQLGGKAVKGKVDRRLSDLQVTFEVRPVR
ncbi:MAG: hypothetical protein SFW67_36080 [Myxococcaceae bacterium]|nr:hypothetical protein [Myxococcaceae bacterium]